jgi:Family of unknown function (DUF6502)
LRPLLKLANKAYKWDNFSLMNSDAFPSSENPSAENPNAADGATALPQREHLRSVLRSLLRPMARLAMAHGVKFNEFADMLKLAYLDAGKQTLAENGQRINASTVSVATGLHRKDASVFLSQDEAHIEAEPPIEARVFARWTTDPRYLSVSGEPLALLRSSGVENGAEGGTENRAAIATFETLVRSITQDVRARAVLESMIRLELVKVNDQDKIELLSHELIPSRAVGKMLDLLRDNTRDHLNAAVSNTLGGQPAYLEQSIYANGLTAESTEKIHQIIRKRWLTLTQAVVPSIQRAIDEDAKVIDGEEQESTRMRVGLYFYSEKEPRQ